MALSINYHAGKTLADLVLRKKNEKKRKEKTNVKMKTFQVQIECTDVFVVPFMIKE